MTPVGILQDVEVRKYYDNDDAGLGKCWQLVEDLPFAGKRPRNSKQPFAEQFSRDHLNKIYRIPGCKGCQGSIDSDLDYGITYKLRDAADKATGQNPGRETITAR